MTAYKRFKESGIDLSCLGLEPGDTYGGYFCTPKGAEVIGWAGVDGIHFCFVKGFGEMVFAVGPDNEPGEYVHPLARSFEDFLRLILSCGLDAAEQSWMWNRSEFDSFLETYPPEPEQRIVLDALQEKLSLVPMDDPYGYIKEVQSTFDYSRLSYPKEYYEVLPIALQSREFQERPDWKVYFDGGFSSRHRGHDKPGEEISLDTAFNWGGNAWCIPAVYSCGRGLVVDICEKIDPVILRMFMDKLQNSEKTDRELNPYEQECLKPENPMDIDFSPRLTVNKKELRSYSGCGACWIPVSCRSEEFTGEYSHDDLENLWFMEHYDLDPGYGWLLRRYSFPWVTKTKPKIKSVSLTLKRHPTRILGQRFSVSGEGDSVSFIHPVSGEKHIIRVAEYEPQEINLPCLGDGLAYPSHCIAMSFSVEPELPRDSFSVHDCGQGDSPRCKANSMKESDALALIGGVDGPTAASAVGIIGGADGPIAIVLSADERSEAHAACSSLYFKLPERIEWQMTFSHKTVEDIELALDLSKGQRN